MVWQQWVLITLYISNIILTIYLIDRPREPISGHAGAVSVVIYCLLSWMVVSI